MTSIPLASAAMPARRPHDLSAVIWIVATGILVVLVGWPLVRLFVLSLQDNDGVATVANYITVATSPRFRTAAWNSFVLATSVGIVSVVVALPLAWATARTDMPGRRVIDILVVSSLVTPGFLTAIAWTLLAGPNAGLLNVAWRASTGAQEPLLNIFSMPGLVFVTSLECFPFAYVVIAGALKSVSAELEDAANMLGAGRWTTMRRVTLPLVLPAILAGFILAFLEALALFGTPAMLGVSANIYVLTTQIWSLFQFPPRLGVAAALALPMLIATAALLVAQRTLIGRRGYVTVTGKSTPPRPVALGAARWPTFVACLSVTVVAVVMTYVVLGAYAVARDASALPGPGNFTLEHFRFVLFDMPASRRGLANSLFLACGAATIAVLLGSLVAYVSERRLVRGARVLGFAAMVPMVIPGIVFAVGLFAAYTRPPFVLYGTLWILLIAYMTKFMPLAYMNASSAVRSIGTELEEAARIAGATGFTAFRRVTFPLIRNGSIAGWLLVFTFSLRELSSSVLLFTNDTIVVAVSVFDLYEAGSWGNLSALGCVLLVINLVVIGAGYALLGRGFLARSNA